MKTKPTISPSILLGVPVNPVKDYRYTADRAFNERMFYQGFTMLDDRGHAVWEWFRNRKLN